MPSPCLSRLSVVAVPVVDVRHVGVGVNQRFVPVPVTVGLVRPADGRVAGRMRMLVVLVVNV